MTVGPPCPPQTLGPGPGPQPPGPGGGEATTSGGWSPAEFGWGGDWTAYYADPDPYGQGSYAGYGQGWWPYAGEEAGAGKAWESTGEQGAAGGQAEAAGWRWPSETAEAGAAGASEQGEGLTAYWYGNPGY